MNLLQARKMVEHLNSIKTQDYMIVSVMIVKDIDILEQYGGFGVRIHDTHLDEIVEYYSISHNSYKSMREQVRTDFDRVYRVHGHIFYRH